MQHTDVVIVAAARTAIGSFGGQFVEVGAIELGAAVVAAVLERAGLRAQQLEGEATEVFLGNVLQAGLGMNSARQVALKAGLPVATPATVINNVCGSGLKAVMLGTRAI